MDCRFCGKKDTPVRQVPLPMPVSDCYCSDCAGKCADHYADCLPKNAYSVMRRMPHRTTSPTPAERSISLEGRVENAVAVMRQLGTVRKSMTRTPVYANDGIRHIYDKITVNIGCDIVWDESKTVRMEEETGEVTVDDHGAIVNNQGSPVQPAAGTSWWPMGVPAQPSLLEEPPAPADKTKATYEAWAKKRNNKDDWRN